MTKIFLNISYRPRILFLFLFPVLSYIAYCGLDWVPKVQLFLIGVLLPIFFSGWILIRKPPVSVETQPFWKVEFLPPLPLWIWLTLAGLLLGVNLYKFGQVPFWPLMDEGTFALYAKDLSQHWKWRLLSGDFQAEPLFLWIYALFFKLFGVSLLNMRIFPILINGFTLGVLYLATREYFSKSLTFVLLALYGFNFWTLVDSRQALQSNLVPLWVFLVLFLLSRYDHVNSVRGWNLGFLLGLTLGSGFYLYTACPAFMAATVLLLIYRYHRKSPVTNPGWGVPLFVMFLSGSPMVLARLSAGGMEYIQYLLKGSVWFVNFAAFFFSKPGSAPNGLIWGGLLNSLLGALCGLGALQILKWRSLPLSRWLVLTVLLTYLPGGLTSHVEFHRAIALFPFILVCVGFGLQALLEDISPSLVVRTTGLGMLMACTITFDLYHYFGPFQDPAIFSAFPNHWTSVELNRAYQIMANHRQQCRRFWVLDHLDDNFKDSTIYTAACGLDDSGMRENRTDGLSEVALLANCNYAPYLEKRFSQFLWIDLGPDHPAQNGNLILGWIPITPVTRDTLVSWRHADQQFDNLLRDSCDPKPHQNNQGIVDQLLSQKNLFESDPFLLAQWTEKIAHFVLIDPTLSRKPVLQALQTAVKNCPSASLLNTLGLLLLEENQPRLAVKAFQAAAQTPGNRTFAADNLRQVDGWLHQHQKAR